MIPIRDTIPSRTHPVVNKTLIGINVAVYLFQLTQGQGLGRFFYFYGLVPARYSVPEIASYFSVPQQAFALVTFMFLHGGFWHLLGNMWSLYIFGDNVEDTLGHVRYLVFYLLCGLLSGLTHFLFNVHANVPTIGASGAIAGVMGAYFILHPHAKILTLVPVLFIPLFFEIPAYFFLGFWLLMQLLNAAGSHGATAGIAWWAHIGGFIFGVALLKGILAIPRVGVDRRLQEVTGKHRTNRLQVLRPDDGGTYPDLHGVIRVSEIERLVGTRKLVNVPSGLHTRMIRVSVPPGIKPGGRLRLAGLGRTAPGGRKGDLYLTVVVDGG